MHVTIIGGGISGLATAFYLQEEARKRKMKIQYSLIESDFRFGGKVVTDMKNGFVIEGGPDQIMTQKPWGIQLCRDLGLSNRLISTKDDNKKTFLAQKGNLIPFPENFTLIPNKFFPFVRSSMFSLWGKLRFGMEWFIPARKETGDESVADFVRRRFGKEALEKIGGPLLAGIHSADPERLSLLSTFPKFSEMERHYGSLIRALLIAKSRQLFSAKNVESKPMFNSLVGGLGEMIEAIVKRLSGDLRLGSRVTKVRFLNPGFEVMLNCQFGETLKTDAVVLAAPAFIAADLVEGMLPDLAAGLRKIRYVSSGTVALAYPKADLEDQHDLKGFGFLVPKFEGARLRGCSWVSSKFNYRAPEDGVLIRGFVGGQDQEEVIQMSDEALVGLVREELENFMGITTKPIFHRIHRWYQGRPQYDVGHLDHVVEMEGMAAKAPGLLLTGSAYRGSGIPDCVKQALDTVERILVFKDGQP